MDKIGLIFSTCYMNGEYGLIHGDRWKYWFEYYSEHLPEFELISHHDGEICDEKKYMKEQYNIVELTPHIEGGELQHVPGWYRSFEAGLKYGINKGYKYITHLESDLYFKKSSLNKLREYLFKDGYYSGWTKRHNFIEESIQIINDENIRQGLLNFIGGEYLNKPGVPGILFCEKVATPETVFLGERLETNIEQILNDSSLEYYAQFWYKDWKNYLEG